MKIEIDDEDAARVQGVLRAVHGGAEINRLAELFTPKDRAKAVLRDITDTMLKSTCAECDDAIHRDSVDDDWEHVNLEAGRDHAAGPEPEGQELVCDHCGASAFALLEGTTDYRPMIEVDVDGQQLTLSASGGGDGDGDDDPGLICDNLNGGGCGLPIDLPDGWETGWG